MQTCLWVANKLKHIRHLELKLSPYKHAFSFQSRLTEWTHWHGEDDVLNIAAPRSLKMEFET